MTVTVVTRDMCVTLPFSLISLALCRCGIGIRDELPLIPTKRLPVLIDESHFAQAIARFVAISISEAKLGPDLAIAKSGRIRSVEDPFALHAEDSDEVPPILESEQFELLVVDGIRPHPEPLKAHIQWFLCLAANLL